MNIKIIRSEFNNWNRKQSIGIGNSREYKIIGCGRKAFKVLKFEPQQELGGIGGWSQVFWNFSQIKKGTEAYEIIKILEKKLL